MIRKEIVSRKILLAKKRVAVLCADIVPCFPCTFYYFKIRRHRPQPGFRVWRNQIESPLSHPFRESGYVGWITRYCTEIRLVDRPRRPPDQSAGRGNLG